MQKRGTARPPVPLLGHEALQHDSKHRLLFFENFHVRLQGGTPIFMYPQKQ